MKFFGNGIVWDKDNNEVLCAFEKGELETEDQRTADILTGLGFESDGMEAAGVNVTQEDDKASEFNEVITDDKAPETQEFEATPAPEIIKGGSNNERTKTNGTPRKTI